MIVIAAITAIGDEWGVSIMDDGGQRWEQTGFVSFELALAWLCDTISDINPEGLPTP